MRRFASALVLLTIAGAACADELPPRAPGLWESGMSGVPGMPPISVKQCIDAKTDLLAQAAVAPGAVCSKREIRKVAAGYEVEASCKVGGMSVDSKGLITGDFASRIRFEAVNTVAGIPGLPVALPPQKIVVEAHRTGACEAGQTPGDIILPDGRKVRPPGM